MNRHHLALAGAVICAITTFVIVPVLVAMGMPHSGFTVPTIVGITLLWIWARGIRKGRA